jgi:hypothetical protein
VFRKNSTFEEKSMLRYIFTIVFILLQQFVQCQTAPYSFFIAGHTYGQPGVNNAGLHPPFVDKFNYIKGRPEIKFGILLGDIVSPGPQPHDWDEVDADIDSLGMPVYFAVGNHDMENRPLFEERYGITYYSFVFNGDLFIILDPNIDGWNISGPQFEFLKNTLNSNYCDVENIFVMFHQLLWWENDNIYSGFWPNSFSGRADTINFWTSVEPLFAQLPNKTVMCAGDVGAVSWSTDFMYDKFANISFVATGMGQSNGDNFIVINVDADKNISYDLICLETSELNCFGELTDYDLLIVPDKTAGNGILMYPNPAKGTVNLNCMRDNKIKSVEVFNINGKYVFSKTYNNTDYCTFDLSGFPKGFYFVNVLSANSQVNMSLIKQ